jgi:chemotaxis protein histidine kinase CheA
MTLRLIPFEHITPRLTRAVRELCRATGRRAALHIGGAQVSLDRSVLEEMVDPLLHILRNAVDHGIRPAEERAAAGKPATGSIRLEVTRVSDGVQIVVEDDGEGMDVDAIRRAAVERGFRTAARIEALDDDAILMLTTIPGFSTARQVSEVSGRGVGMDIVRTRVEAMRGHMTIRSRRGVGTRIELRLPLSVAILDAFLVESAAGVFAVPAASVTEVRALAAAPAARAGDGTVTELDDVLRADGSRSPRGRECPVLTWQSGYSRGALAVDRVLGRQDVVVRPLGPPLERLRRYSGAALLDDGQLALVLDLANLTG